MEKNRASRRYYRNRAINRKLGILKRIGGDDYVFAWTGSTPGRLAKGKIHCSCWMCRTKSYDEPSVRDRRHAEAARQQLEDLRKGE